MSWLPTFNNKVLLLPAALSIQMASILAGSTAAGRFLAGLVLKKLNWFTVLATCLVLAACMVLVAIPLAQKNGGACCNRMEHSTPGGLRISTDWLIDCTGISSY